MALTQPQQQATYTEMQAEWLRRDLRRFVPEVWHLVEAREFKNNWHLDAICLPGDAIISTEEGPRTIGSLVDSGWTGRVLSYNHVTDRAEFQPITRLMKTRFRPLVRIIFDGNSLELTENHPVFIDGKGYVAAAEAQAGDAILYVPALRQDVSATPKQGREVLQPKVLWGEQDQVRDRDLSFMRWAEGMGKRTVSKLLGGVAAYRERLSLLQLREARLHDARKFGLCTTDTWGVLWDAVLRGIHSWRAESPIHQWLEPEVLSVGVPSDKTEYLGAGVTRSARPRRSRTW